MNGRKVVGALLLVIGVPSLALLLCLVGALAYFGLTGELGKPHSAELWGPMVTFGIFTLPGAFFFFVGRTLVLGQDSPTSPSPTARSASTIVSGLLGFAAGWVAFWYLPFFLRNTSWFGPGWMSKIGVWGNAASAILFMLLAMWAAGAPRKKEGGR